MTPAQRDRIVRAAMSWYVMWVRARDVPTLADGWQHEDITLFKACAAAAKKVKR